MSTQPKAMEWSRRAVLGAGLGGLLVGCGSNTQTAAPAGGQSPPASPKASPKPTTKPSPTAAPLPTLEEIVEKFGRKVPHEWGLEVTGMLLRLDAAAAKSSRVALTFDACGGPTPQSSGCGIDRKLVDLLRTHQAKATLFLNRRWVEANHAFATELAADPLFEIGNHGTKHMPLSVNGRTAYTEQGTRSVSEVYAEVMGNFKTLVDLTGKPPRWYRSGTAHCDEVAVQICAALGQRVVNFSINGDAGTTFTANQIVTSLADTRPGDIVISHMNRPEHDTAEGYTRALPALLARGLKTAKLSEVVPA